MFPQINDQYIPTDLDRMLKGLAFEFIEFKGFIALTLMGSQVTRINIKPKSDTDVAMITFLEMAEEDVDYINGELHSALVKAKYLPCPLVNPKLVTLNTQVLPGNSYMLEQMFIRRQITDSMTLNEIVAYFPYCLPFGVNYGHYQLIQDAQSQVCELVNDTDSPGFVKDQMHKILQRMYRGMES